MCCCWLFFLLPFLPLILNLTVPSEKLYLTHMLINKQCALRRTLDCIKNRKNGSSTSKIVTLVSSSHLQYIMLQESSVFENGSSATAASECSTTGKVGSSSIMCNKCTVSVALLEKKTAKNLFAACQRPSQEGATMDGNVGSSTVSSRHRDDMASETRAVDEDVRNSPMALKSNKAKAKILSLTSAAEDGPKVSFQKKNTAHTARSRAHTHIKIKIIDRNTHQGAILFIYCKTSYDCKYMRLGQQQKKMYLCRFSTDISLPAAHHLFPFVIFYVYTVIFCIK